MDPKDPKDPANSGNPDGNQKGTPDPNVVALQQKLSEKDVELKTMQAKMAELEKSKQGDEGTNKVLSEMSETVKTLTATISKMESDKQREVLKVAYPDIHPDLLLGKTTEEVERLVKEQRETISKNYTLLPSAHAPKYSSRAEIEKEIEALKSDPNLTTEQRLMKARDLKIAIEEF